jgi:hypothetical protein
LNALATGMFENDDDLARADWPLLQDGASTLFFKPSLLADTKRDLAALEYKIADVDCTTADPTFEQQLSDILCWKLQFGYEPWSGGLNALVDGLREFPFGASGRCAIVFNGFDRIVARDADFAHAVLDIFEGAARDHLLWRKLLIILVQTNDPAFSCSPLGSRSIRWNRREWSNSDRGL